MLSRNFFSPEKTPSPSPPPPEFNAFSVLSGKGLAPFLYCFRSKAVPPSSGTLLTLWSHKGNDLSPPLSPRSPLLLSDLLDLLLTQRGLPGFTLYGGIDLERPLQWSPSEVSHSPHPLPPKRRTNLPFFFFLPPRVIFPRTWG